MFIRIPDPNPNFFHPGSRVEKIPESASTSKNFCILIAAKEEEEKYGLGIPDLEKIYPDRGVKKAPDPDPQHEP
jgi:hypothetical protein